uniref:catalase-related domain-containing protein n=1 Tax=Undibacterium sp. TaxID=1914977 RepID=UPI00374D9BB9
VNRPRCPVNHQQRDGAMAASGFGRQQNYAPVESAGLANSGFGNGDSGWALEGKTGRFDGRGNEDDYSQAGNLFRLLPADEKDRLTSNIAGAMRSVPDDIKQRQLAHFDLADPAYGAAVRAKLSAA